MPEEHGAVAVKAVKLTAMEAESAFAGFEAARETKRFEHEAKVNMYMGQFDVEEAFNVGDVELLAIVGDEDGKALDIAQKLLKVVAIDIVTDGGAIVERDRGKIIAVAGDAGGFDIKEGGTVAEFGEKAP